MSGSKDKYAIWRECGIEMGILAARYERLALAENNVWAGAIMREVLSCIGKLQYRIGAQERWDTARDLEGQKEFFPDPVRQGAFQVRHD